MADNVQVNTGSGAVIAADDVSGVFFQKVKIDGGGDGASAPIGGDASNGLDVDVTRVQGTVTVGDGGSSLSVDDNGGTLSVDDGAGSLTVDNGGTFVVQENGAALTSLQLIDDTVYTDGSGTPSKAIGVAGTDGTNPQIIKTDAAGELQVDVLTLPNVTIGTNANLAESIADDAAFTPATSRVLPAGFTFDDVAPDSVNEGDIGAGRMSANRNQYIQIRDNAGNERGMNVDSGGNANVIAAANNGVDIGDVTINNSTGGSAVNVQDGGNSLTVDDGSGSLTVDNGGTFVVQENGAALTALQLIDNIVTTEDTASANGDSGIVAFARRTGTPANTSGTDGDYEALQVSAGRLWTSTVIDTALPAGTAAIGKLAANDGVDIGDVTINNASGGSAVNIQDGGNSITVDGTVTATLGAGKAEDAAAADADIGLPVLAVRRDAASSGVGTDGDYAMLSVTSDGSLRVSGGGGGTQYAEDAAHSSGDTGTLSLSVRRDANTSLVGTDGDYAPLQVDATGSLKVAIISGAGSGGTAMTDDAAFTPGTTSVTPIAAMADETGPDSVDEGDAGIVRMSLNRSLFTQIRDAAGNERGMNVDASGRIGITDGGGSLTVDGSVALGAADGVDIGNVDVASVVPGTGATNLGKAEDGAHTSGDVGVMGLAVRTDTPANRSGTDGDYEPLQVSAGRLWASATIDAALPAGANAIGKLAANSGVDIGDIDVTSVIAGVGATNLGKAEDAAHASGDTGVAILGVRRDTAASGAGTDGDYATLNLDANGRLYAIAQAVGDVAHDGVDAGNPVKLGGRALAHGTNPTAVAAADRTDWLFNRAGIPWVMGGHPNIVTIEAAYTAAQTDTAIVTIATGLKIVVTQVQFVCENANTVAVAVRVGFGTANTPTTTGVVLTHPGVAAGSGVSRGDGSGIIGVGADNEDLRITCSVPTTGSCRVLVSYYTIET